MAVRNKDLEALMLEAVEVLLSPRPAVESEGKQISLDKR